MQINRHNYEAFLLDLHEGRLSVDEKQQVLDFLRRNPDCDDGMLEGESWFLEPEVVHFPASETLKKELPDETFLLHDHNFDLFSIARMEGDLSEEQEAIHRNLIKTDKQKATQWEEWQKTRLFPEPVMLKEKKQLYRRKRPGSRVFWLSVTSAAAAVALFIVLFRMDPVLPRQELGQEVIPESTKQQPPETPDKAAQQQRKTVQSENQPVEDSPAPMVEKKRNSVMFSVKKEHELPAEFHKSSPPEDDMQGRPLRIPENMMNSSLLLEETVPDRIEPLDIPPVSIHLSSLTIAQLYEMDIQDLVDEYGEEQHFSLWTIANAGIKGINKITGSDISLLASRDEDGEVSGFRLQSRHFSMTRPLGRDE